MDRTSPPIAYTVPKIPVPNMTRGTKKSVLVRYIKEIFILAVTRIARLFGLGSSVLFNKLGCRMIACQDAEGIINVHPLPLTFIDRIYVASRTTTTTKPVILEFAGSKWWNDVKIEILKKLDQIPFLEYRKFKDFVEKHISIGETCIAHGYVRSDKHAEPIHIRKAGDVNIWRWENSYCNQLCLRYINTIDTYLDNVVRNFKSNNMLPLADAEQTSEELYRLACVIAKE